MSTSPDSTRIVFFGTPDFAVPTLRKLMANGYSLSAVVTSPDKPVGRKKVLTPSPVKVAAQELGLPVLSPATLKDDAFFSQFSELKPDLCIVVAYGKLIPERYLQLPRLGFLNIHPSLLPAYRGPSPIQSAILDGLTTTGVSVMLLDAEMDHGPVVAQKEWDIPADADYPFCEQALADLGAELLIQTLPGYIAGTIMPREQIHENATFTKKFERADGRIDWKEPAQKIHDRIRALGTNPGTWTTWGGKILNIFRTRPIALSANRPPGSAFRIDGEFAVACGHNALLIDELQLEGSRRQNAREFLSGHGNIQDAVLD